MTEEKESLNLLHYPYSIPIEEVEKCEYGDKDGMCRMVEDTPHKCIVLFGIRCDDSMPPNWWEKKTCEG